MSTIYSDKKNKDTPDPRPSDLFPLLSSNFRFFYCVPLPGNYRYHDQILFLGRTRAPGADFCDLGIQNAAITGGEPRCGDGRGG